MRAYDCEVRSLRTLFVRFYIVFDTYIGGISQISPSHPIYIYIYVCIITMYVHRTYIDV